MYTIKSDQDPRVVEKVHLIVHMTREVSSDTADSYIEIHLTTTCVGKLVSPIYLYQVQTVTQSPVLKL